MITNTNTNIKELEKSLKALANNRRLTILKYLKKNKRATVGEMAKEINLSFKSTSKHLAVLFAANIVEKDQISLQMLYYLSSKQTPEVKDIVSLL